MSAAGEQWQRTALRLAMAIDHGTEIGLINEQALDTYTRQRLQEFREAQAAYLPPEATS